ncbi:MAG: aldose epimerase family protein, partial [Muribaculaceae bacterium]
QNQIWDCAVVDEKVVFSRLSPDGEENYPGNLQAKVQYTWTEDNQLILDFHATTDKTTVINLTNHAYFNLGGENSGSVLNHILWLNCDHFLPTDETLIPTGEIAPVAGTPMDFTTAKPLGRDMNEEYKPLIIGKGYDHCFVVSDWHAGELKHVATLSHPQNGREMQVFTTQPAAQVYGGNYLDGSPISKSGRPYNDYDGVAIECQGMPDAPNKPNFPSQTLKPGEEYKQTIIFKFNIK